MATKQIFRNNARKDAAINQQRKRLQQLRLQTESQNTKLLKIQQKQRQVQAQYQNEKRKMEETLSKLTLEAENFMNKQLSTTQQFESQKEQIFSNDRKKQQYLKQKQQLEFRNSKRKDEIRQKEQKLAKKKEKLLQIRNKIKRYQIYEDFLKEVKGLSDDFSTGQFDQFTVMTILQRYKTMDKKKQQLSDVHKRIGIDKQNKAKSIQMLKKLKQQKLMQYNAKIKQLKQNIDSYSEQSIQLESDLQGKLNENRQKQRQLGQVIFSIRGLYLSIVGDEKQKQKTSLQMLQVIKQQRKKLRQYLELYQKKTQQKKS